MISSQLLSLSNATRLLKARTPIVVGNPILHQTVGLDAAHRKGSSALTAVSEGAELSFAVRPLYRSSVTSIPTAGRPSSWLPSPTDMAALRPRPKSSLAFPRSQSFASHDGGHEGLPALHRGRRISSTGPLTLPDGINAWNRKPSVMSIPSDDESQAVRSLDLVRSAWILLEASVKHYKMGLNILVDSNLLSAHLARVKNETLIGIAYCAMFMASLAPRFSLTAEKREALLVSAEVYSTWAAREVGWSSLIEGTEAAHLADRRTNSWRADEANKRAVMLLVRIWWYRAVTSQTIDVDTKSHAKDAVETVVKRMKDKEAAKEGDVFRLTHWLYTQERELDTAEGLFWRSICRILRGGPRFVMR